MSEEKDISTLLIEAVEATHKLIAALHDYTNERLEQIERRLDTWDAAADEALRNLEKSLDIPPHAKNGD